MKARVGDLKKSAPLVQRLSRLAKTTVVGSQGKKRDETNPKIGKKKGKGLPVSTTKMASHEETMFAMKDAPTELLAEDPVPPSCLPEGVPLEEKLAPLAEVHPQTRGSFAPSLVHRADVDCSPLVDLLEKEGAMAWDADNQAETNVPFERPAHDRWGVGKIMLIHCDDFMKKVYHMPWWTERPQFREAIEPFFKALGVPTHRVVRCLLAKLPIGTTIPVHHDTGFWVSRSHRLHAPVVTDGGVIFRAGPTEPLMQRYRLEVGGVYELNNQSKHYVSNWGATERVHLIFDYVDDDESLPPVEVCERGEVLLQTRRSIDRPRHAGSRQPGPSFVILGAQKSGTTAVYEYLHQHPLVLRGARRESHALDWRWEAKATSVEQKRRFAIGRFFDVAKLEANPSLLSGDSTPSYLLHSDLVIPRLVETSPEVQLIVCLRDPVARAYSHYQVRGLRGPWNPWSQHSSLTAFRACVRRWWSTQRAPRRSSRPVGMQTGPTNRSTRYIIDKVVEWFLYLPGNFRGEFYFLIRW